ncbi:MAG: DUF1211 domain-containing protein [Chitinophagales bacterium]|nr:DUF1211 domain-containing protein [Chitinophagales bacterium]
MQSNDLHEINKLKLHRLIFFSDAVLAIIITLLVIELHLPDLADSSSATEMFEKLLYMVPNFGAFLICFLTITQAWVGLNTLFSAVVKYDNTLGLLNAFSLLPICLLPFVASLIGNYFDNPASFIFLSGVSFASSIAQSFVNRHLFKNKMLSPLVDHKYFEKLMKTAIVFPIVSLLIGLTAYLSTLLSFSLFMLAILYSMWILHKMKLTSD